MHPLSFTDGIRLQSYILNIHIYNSEMISSNVPKIARNTTATKDISVELKTWKINDWIDYKIGSEK